MFGEGLDDLVGGFFGEIGPTYHEVPPSDPPDFIIYTFVGIGRDHRFGEKWIFLIALPDILGARSLSRNRIGSGFFGRDALNMV